MCSPKRCRRAKSEGRRIPRCQLGRLSMAKNDMRSRRWERRDAHGPARIDVLDVDSPRLCHALTGVASHPRRVSASVLETI
jgi:hypothetical protein